MPSIKELDMKFSALKTQYQRTPSRLVGMRKVPGRGRALLGIADRYSGIPTFHCVSFGLSVRLPFKKHTNRAEDGLLIVKINVGIDVHEGATDVKVHRVTAEQSPAPGIFIE